MRVGRGGQGVQGCSGSRAHNNIAEMPRIYESPITKMAYDTFNTGMSKHTALFTKSRKNIVNYIQRSSLDESFLVAHVIRMGAEQTIVMMTATNMNDTDDIIERTDQVRAVAKKRAKLDASIKRGFATLYD